MFDPTPLYPRDDSDPRPLPELPRLFDRYQEEAAALSASYDRFVDGAWPVLCKDPLIREPYVDEVCEHIEAWCRRQILDLMVHLRPRMGKTLLCSVMANAWTWTWDPTAQFMTSSFSDARKKEDARLTRMLVLSPWYQARWPIMLAADQSEKDRFAIVPGGHRFTAIYGSGATGDGGSHFIVDDGQCAADQWSMVELERDSQWFTDTWDRRRNQPDRSPSMVTCQRLGPFDLANAIRMKNPDRWQVLSLQTRKTIVDMAPYYQRREDGSVSIIHLPLIDTSISRKRPVDNREPGELLSSRVVESDLDALERDSVTAYAAQEQQSPILRAAGLVKLYRFADSNVIDFAEEMGTPDLRSAVQKALQTGWYGLLGMDHGLDARREVCHALLVEPTRRQIRLVGSYVNQRRTGVEADAEGIAAMLDAIGLPVAFIRLSVGDVGSTGKRDETPQSINAVLGKILGLTVHLPDKTAGSIDRGVEALNSLLGSGALRFDRSCGSAIACAQNWTGAETWKDGIDAFRYPVYQVAREWLVGGLTMQSV